MIEGRKARNWEKVNTKEEKKKSPEKRKRKHCTKWRRHRQSKVGLEKVSTLINSSQIHQEC